MPLYEDEFSPGDDLWDLVHEAAERAMRRLGEPAVVVSQGEHGYDERPCASVEEARRVVHDLLAPDGAWRAAIAWREGDMLLMEAQDAETDPLAARFTVPVERRRRLLGTEERLGEVGFPEPVPPLRAPSWTGAVWTLRAGGAVVADLRVVARRHAYLHAEVTPRAGLGDVLTESPHRQPPAGDWSLHAPDGAADEGLELELNREQASWRA